MFYIHRANLTQTNAKKRSNRKKKHTNYAKHNFVNMLIHVPTKDPDPIRAKHT